MPSPFERGRKPQESLAEESAEVQEIKDEIAALEAQRAKIERRLAEARVRLAEAQQAPEHVEYAEFKETIPLPGTWTMEVPNDIDLDGRGQPQHFKPLVLRLRELKKSGFGSREYDELMADYASMAAGKLDARSRANEEMTLQELRQKHYPGWGPQDFRKIVDAVPETREVKEAPTFDHLAEAFQARMEKAGKDSYSYFTADSFNRRMNEALLEFVEGMPEGWLNGHVAERLADAKLYDDVSLDDLEEEWFTADEDSKKILFEGEAVASYSLGRDDGYGGRIKSINERKLRSALEAFLRKTLTHLPREAA